MSQSFSDQPYKLIITHDALSDLDSAYGWIKDYSDDAAKDFLVRLRQKMEINLTETPRMGVQLELADDTELYALTSDQYRIFYGVDEMDRVVTVFRILHTSRNIKHILKLAA